MTEENNSQANTGDKNWKEIREQNEFLKGKVAEYEAKERTQVFKLAGLDPTKGVGKAVDMMFEGELNVDNIKQYATEEFGGIVNVIAEPLLRVMILPASANTDVYVVPV